jgi:sulfoxide reductase heme-binding subunit YedZ
MHSSDPLQLLPWLISRASGILALTLISLAAMTGLAMAAKLLRGPGVKRLAAGLHEYTALIALLAIAVHGVALLGDRWLKPGWTGITIPFALGYRPGFTGLGIIAGYLALLLGPSFYLRRRIGARRWRSLHRAIVLVWALSAIHTLGSGTDGNAVWLRLVVLAPGVPIAYLLVTRALRSLSPSRGRRPALSPPGPPAAGPPAAALARPPTALARPAREPAA